jgi:hypothetical protein
MALTPDDPTKAQAWIRGIAPNQFIDLYVPRGAKGDPGGIALGTDLPDANLNSYVTSGVYRQTNPLFATQLNNYPAMNTIAGGILTVHQRDPSSTVVLQMFQATSGSYDARVFWQRLRVSGTWTPWRTYASTRVDQTAGRAIYQWDEVNQREQLIYGDTGKRNISSSFPNAGNAGVLLSRQGNTTTLLFADYLDNTSGGNAVWTNVIPVGFRPANWVYMPIPSGRTIVIQNGGTITCGQHSGTVYQGSISWRTDETWPTSLPGVAVGSIPAN